MKLSKRLSMLFLVFTMFFTMLFVEPFYAQTSLNTSIENSAVEFLTQDEIDALLRQEEDKISPFFLPSNIVTGHYSQIVQPYLNVWATVSTSNLSIPVPQVFGFFEIYAKLSDASPYVKVAGGTHWSFKKYMVNQTPQSSAVYNVALANMPVTKYPYEIRLYAGYYEVDGVMYTLPTIKWLH